MFRNPVPLKVRAGSFPQPLLRNAHNLEAFIEFFCVHLYGSHSEGKGGGERSFFFFPWGCGSTYNILPKSCVPLSLEL